MLFIDSSMTKLSFADRDGMGQAETQLCFFGLFFDGHATIVDHNNLQGYTLKSYLCLCLCGVKV